MNRLILFLLLLLSTPSIKAQNCFFIVGAASPELNGQEIELMLEEDGHSQLWARTTIENSKFYFQIYSPFHIQNYAIQPGEDSTMKGKCPFQSRANNTVNIQASTTDLNEWKVKSDLTSKKEEK